MKARSKLLFYLEKKSDLSSEPWAFSVLDQKDGKGLA
jgi:hypothetical protein